MGLEQVWDDGDQCHRSVSFVSAQDARFKPPHLVALDNQLPRGLQLGQWHRRWVHYELQEETLVVRAERTISALTGVLCGTRRRLLRTAGQDTTAVT